jgi:DNA polymerase delta subunit 2
MRMYCEGLQNTPIKALELTLRMRTMFPTCPDTLRCYPGTVEDPFIIDQAPHVYFAGNQPRFEQMDVGD